MNPVYTPGSGDISLGYADLTLTAFGNSPCPSASETIRLTIQPLPVVDAGSSITLCATASDYQVTGASATNTSSLLWTITQGTGSLEDATTLTPTYTFGTGEIGPVVLRLTGQGISPCGSASDEMTITLTPAPAANAGLDGETCEGSNYTISGTSASNYSSILWTEDGDGTLTGATTLTPTYIPAPAETGTVTLTLTVQGNTPCSVPAVDQMQLEITPKPLIDAGSGGTTGGLVCEGLPFTVSDATATNTASILWTAPGPGYLTNAATLTPTYTPATGQLGFITLTMTASANGSCSNASDQVTYELKPTGSLTFQPQSGTVCLNNDFVMSVAASGGSGTFAYQWQSSVIGAAGPYNDISGATNTTYNTGINTMTGTTWYRCVVTQTGSVCDPLLSDVASCEVETCCPVTFNETLVTCRATSALVNVLNGDYSPEGSPLTLNPIPVSGPLHGGTFTFVSGTSFEYIPDPGFSGADTVIVQWCDDTPCCTNEIGRAHV